MLFHSTGFLFIFLPVFLVSVLVVPKGMARSVVLLIFSYLFYSGAEPFFLIILLVSSLTDYFVAIKLFAEDRLRMKKLWLCVSISINLGILAFYKYGVWVIPGMTPLFDYTGVPVPDPEFFKTYILPAGISFYTFQSMSYTIDVYRGLIKPERNIISFCNYVAYLPQLIAGPIERFSHLHPQLVSFSKGEVRHHWTAGIDRIMLGIAQKILIADSCGLIVDRLLQAGETQSFITAWAIALGFGMQIYYDFAAYTHMAIGISLLLGVRLQENFLSPYKATSIQDFWRRWHITLSRWFRDYLYIPLGGSKKGLPRTILNLLLTFLLVGLWHGAGWNYVAWGTIHGVLIGLYHIKGKIFPNWSTNKMIAIAITFIVVHFAWVPFRVDDTVIIVDLWRSMLGLNSFEQSMVSMSDMFFILIVVSLTLILPNASQRWPGRSGSLESSGIAVTAIFAVLSAPQIAKFIYFQF